MKLYFRLIIVIMCLTTGFLSCSKDNVQTDSNGQIHPAAESIDGFNLTSYYAGSISTVAEFVGSGCKKLGLSAVYDDKMLEKVLPYAKDQAEEYGTPYYVEDDLLVTKLFPADIAKGFTVILFAYEQAVLDEYFALKQKRKDSIANENLADVEFEIAWAFGRLLSYTDKKIEALLAQR